MNRRSILAGGLLSMLVAVPVLASHVTPEVVDEAESCAPLAPGTAELVVQVPQDVGTLVDGDFTVDIELEGNVGEGSISFSNATLPVAAAFIAGTDGGNLYTYDEPVTEDDGLVAPDDSPIKDVSLCYVSDNTAASEAPAATGEASPEASVGGETASPTAPPTDTVPATVSNTTSLVLLVVGAIALLAALGLGVRAPGRVRRH
jgi:hypothetical protein